LSLQYLNEHTHHIAILCYTVTTYPYRYYMLVLEYEIKTFTQ